MSQEFANASLPTPAEIVAKMTEATHELHNPAEIALETSSESSSDDEIAVGPDNDAPGPTISAPAEPLTQPANALPYATVVDASFDDMMSAVEALDEKRAPGLPQMVPRNSDFVPEIGSWWEFVDLKPQYAYLVKSIDGDRVFVTELFFRNEFEVMPPRTHGISVNDFRSGLLVEAPDSDMLIFLDAYQVCNGGTSPSARGMRMAVESKNVEEKSDPERSSKPAESNVDQLFEAVAGELGVERLHVQRLTETVLEGIRSFAATKTFLATSPAITSFLTILTEPESLSAISNIFSLVFGQLVQAEIGKSSVSTLLLDVNEAVLKIEENLGSVTSDLVAKCAELQSQIEKLKKELVARRQWETAYDEFANSVRERLEKTDARIDDFEKTVDKLLVSPVLAAALRDVTKVDEIDSRINPQTNELREQIATLFERCDMLERNRLKDQQRKSKAERERKAATAAKAPQRREAVNAASRTLQERKRREEKENAALERAAARRVGSQSEKRGRGRPPTRKAVAEVNIFDGAPVKRGPGRPRKNP